jgi:DNA-binding transcriptional LysR family regulator
VSADLKHLRIVIAAAECGSFSSAALQLNTEVSAVSRAVRELEDDLGVALFERLPRGVRLTEAGRSYVVSAGEVIERYERASVDARRAGAGQVLQLAIGLVWSAASKPVVQLLRAFAADFRTVGVELLEGANDGLTDRVRSGRLDVAIAATDPPPCRGSRNSGHCRRYRSGWSVSSPSRRSA